MARRWDTKDANGKPLTDGRICLVIESEEPGMAPIYVYGKDKDDVIDKLAGTTETAQVTIHRLRKSPPVAPPPSAPPVASATGVTADEQARATADLNNPAKAPQAVKTLLRAAGLDVDQATKNQDAQKLASLCMEWERRNPEFPFDPRNQRMLVDRAILRYGHRNLSLASLDTAYEELRQENMFFEPKAPAADPTTVQPRGSEDSRTVRTATTYRRNSLRADTPAPEREQESAKIQRWRKILSDGNTKELREAFETEAGFQDWANKALAKTA